MKFIINGRVDIRPLAQQDRAHVGLPYDAINVSDDMTTIADGVGDSVSFTATNWGAGLAFYPYSLSLLLDWAADPGIGADDGIELQISIPAISEVYFTKTYVNTELQPYLVNPVIRRWRTTATFSAFRVAATETLTITLVNESGLEIASAGVRVVGIAI